MFANKLSRLNEIPKCKFIGYIWFSDQQNPIILHNETFDFNNVDLNPFIIEAMLFIPEKNQSISIKHADDYIIVCFDCSKLDNSKEKYRLINKKYLAYKLPEIQYINMTEIWEREDVIIENVNNFSQWVFKAEFFTGF